MTLIPEIHFPTKREEPVNQCTGSAATAQIRPSYLTARGVPAAVNRTCTGASRG